MSTTVKAAFASVFLVERSKDKFNNLGRNNVFSIVIFFLVGRTDVFRCSPIRKPEQVAFC